MKNNPYIFLSIMMLAIIAGGTYAHVQIATVFSSSAQVICSTAITPPAITARAAYVYDVKENQVLFAKNSEDQLPLASLTKLVTALVAREALSSKDTVTISESALLPEGESGLYLEEVWKVDDLIDFTLVTSSNDGARALALAGGAGSLDMFLDAMNRLMTRIGARQTFFLNETGLDVSSTTAGAYGSARDIARLLAYAYTQNIDVLLGSAQAANSYTSLSGFEHPATHTSDVAGSIPGQLVVKTGFTDLAGGNLAILSEVLPGRPVAVVVMGATRETRDSDAIALLDAGTRAVKRDTLCHKSAL